MDRKKIILPRLLYANAPESDTNLRVGLKEEQSLLRNDDRDVVLDLSEQFREERNRSLQYKIYGKMRMVFSNPFYGVSNYEPLEKKLYLLGDGSDGNFCGYMPYDEFAFIRKDVNRQSTENVSVINTDDFTGFTYSVSGDTSHVTIEPTEVKSFNWGFYTSYVFDHDTNFPISYTLSGDTASHFVSGDGIPFRVYETDGDIVLVSPVKHGMNVGEYVVIDDIPYFINRVGNAVYNSENYVMYISKSQIDTTFGDIVLGKRCVDITNVTGSTSSYYVHKHKILTNESGCNVEKTGFESPIWEDEKKLVYLNSVGEQDVMVEKNRMESILFDVVDPFILSGITNNMGYTPTEVYLSVIFKNGNGYFNYPPKIGYSFHLHNDWIDSHFSGDKSIETGITYTNTIVYGVSFTMGEELNVGDVITGAFVEYVPTEMKERVVSEALHKITPVNEVFYFGQTSSDYFPGSSTDNPVGLLYQPHYRFKIRELSPYVETYGKSTPLINLPENAVYDENEGIWKWRDLYDHGYIDNDGFGTDYPFLNGMHYVDKTINFYIRGEKGYRNKQDKPVSFFTRGDGEICPDNFV